MHVLIAEDDPIVAAMLGRLIKHWFHSVTVSAVSDGAAALAFCRVHRVDVIIADYQMPEIDGVTLARMLYVHPPERKFILLSGAIDQIQEMCFPGVDCCVAKPTGLPILRSLLAGVIASHTLPHSQVTDIAV